MKKGMLTLIRYHYAGMITSFLNGISKKYGFRNTDFIAFFCNKKYIASREGLSHLSLELMMS